MFNRTVHRYMDDLSGNATSGSPIEAQNHANTNSALPCPHATHAVLEPQTSCQAPYTCTRAPACTAATCCCCCCAPATCPQCCWPTNRTIRVRHASHSQREAQVDEQGDDERSH